MSELVATMTGLAVGPFELEGVLGSGGMADVYAGRHVATDVPVAVKVVRAEYLDDEVFLSAFGREVRAVAALDHPCIVGVLDSGRINGAAAQASGGRLRAGSPYLVMRRANRGTLDGLGAPLPWELLPPLCARLLEGLAHAHAHGVIHRDLKPANVLVHEEADSPEVWLSDFGIAHQARLGRATDAFDRGSIMGTPGYMAPEQLLARWRDYGPWTDLYAVGAIIWALLMGQDPFDTSGATPQQALFRRLQQPFPPLPETVAPEEARRFVKRLTAKDPQNRYRHAADALAELPGERLASLRLPRTRAAMSDATTWLQPVGGRVVDSAAAAPRQSSRPPPSASRPPMPLSHRRSVPPQPPMSLVGAGLGLYGLRHVPLAGRHAERDALWSSLREVVDEGALRVTLLAGGSGVGKSRLAAWLAHRADELGLVSVLRASFQAEGPGDELAQMVAEHFVCVGLPWPRVRQRLVALLEGEGEHSSYDERALASLMAPLFGAAAALDTPLTFASAQERFLALASWLTRLAQQRPVLLLLDDLQWGPDALAFVEYLLDTTPVPGLLVVATLESEALAYDAGVRARVEALSVRSGASRLTLGPLSPEEEERLVHGLLRLDEPLAREVSLRAGGHPLHARQLVGELVRRGALQPSEQGFQLAPGVELDLPDDLHDVWSRRVARVATPGSDDERAVQLAACLGMRLEVALWQAACTAAGLRPSTDLWERMALEGLVSWRGSRSVADAETARAQSEAGAVEFSHAWLRASLERAAREQGRWDDSIRGCLVALDSWPDGEETRERRARLLADCGRGRDAAPLLRAAAQLRVERSHYTEAYALLDRHEACLVGLEGDDAERERGWGRAVRSRVRRLTARWQEAKDDAHEAEAIARRLGDDELWAAASSRLGEIAMRQGLLAEAEAALAQAEQLGASSADPTFLFVVRWNRAWVQLVRGQPLQAAETFARMARLGEHSEALRRRFLHPLWSHAMALMVALELEQAEQVVRKAVALSRRLDHRLALAHALDVQASISLLRGRLPEACREATESLALYQAIGSPEAHFADVMLLRARFEAGEREGLEEQLAQGQSANLDDRPFVAARYLGLAVRVALVDGAVERAERELSTLLEAVRRTEVVDVFIARDLLLGVHAAGLSGEPKQRFLEAAEAHLGGASPGPVAAARAQWSAGRFAM